jgi:cell division protein FtsI (penicillin-binding protein 3)
MGKIYGGAVAAPVFKEIADKIFATRLNIHDNELRKDTIPDSIPIYHGPAFFEDVHEMYAMLGIKTDNRAFNNEWIVSQGTHDNVMLESYKSYPDSMPDFSGMTLKDAVYLIEQLGLKPEIHGNGQVVWQSIPSGSLKVPGQIIELKLNNL